MEAGDFMTKAGKAGNICKIMSLSGIIPVSGISFCLVQKKYLTMPIWQKYPKLWSLSYGFKSQNFKKIKLIVDKI